MIDGKLVWLQEEVRKKDISIALMIGIFPYVHHIGCAFNLHSVINNGLTPGRQDLSRRQTIFFLPIDPRDKKLQIS